VLTATVPVLNTLRSKMKIKAAREDVYKKYETELVKMIAELDKFVCNSGDTVAEAEALKKSDDDDVIAKLDKKLEATLKAAEHHSVGSKAAKQRFQGLIAG
jgi:hypothetical protein